MLLLALAQFLSFTTARHCTCGACSHVLDASGRPLRRSRFRVTDGSGREQPKPPPNTRCQAVAVDEVAVPDLRTWEFRSVPPHVEVLCVQRQTRDRPKADQTLSCELPGDYDPCHFAPYERAPKLVWAIYIIIHRVLS